MNQAKQNNHSAHAATRPSQTQFPTPRKNHSPKHTFTNTQIPKKKKKEDHKPPITPSPPQKPSTMTALASYLTIYPMIT